MTFAILPVLLSDFLTAAVSRCGVSLVISETKVQVAQCQDVLQRLHLLVEKRV
jgi:hypothetical protein